MTPLPAGRPCPECGHGTIYGRYDERCTSCWAKRFMGISHVESAPYRVKALCACSGACTDCECELGNVGRVDPAALAAHRLVPCAPGDASPYSSATRRCSEGGDVKRTAYAKCAEWFLWRVTMDTQNEIDHRSPSVLVVARSSGEAAAEALEILRQDWKDEARWLKVLETRALHPINGMATASEPPGGGTTP